ncbi:MAG: hypothetical protein JSV49_01640, partial [Thermoplasmata archaeon]
MAIKVKISTVIVSIILILSLLVTFNFDKIQAARDDMNLEGDIYLNNTFMLANTTWRNDTEFCIWVYHIDHWTRYPNTGWQYTSMGRYFFMLPSDDNGTHWSNGDKYRVQINGVPSWNISSTNFSSHGTGDPGAYTPVGDINNYILWNDPDNWQRWDIEAPDIDLIPTNVKVNGINYYTTPTYISINASSKITISANVTNIGTSKNPTAFNFTFYNSTREGISISPELILDVEISQKLTPYGGDSGNYLISWVTPSVKGVYFVAINADYYNVIPESNKTNNLFIIGFIIGGVPDLALTNVTADEIKYDSSPSPLIYAGKEQDVIISANVPNIGT